jgi:hypothetical protein
MKIIPLERADYAGTFYGFALSDKLNLTQGL